MKSIGPAVRQFVGPHVFPCGFSFGTVRLQRVRTGIPGVRCSGYCRGGYKDALGW